MSLTMKEKWERRIIPFLMETLGGILVAVALDSFAVNAEFPLTGFSGIALIFNRLFGLPLGAPGILSAVVLGFLEYWNAIEASQAFLKNQALWPLSLYMPNITADNAGVSLIASLITLMPPLLIFLSGQKYLEQGIISSGMKD